MVIIMDIKKNDEKVSKELRILREVVKLNPIDSLRVLRARKQAEYLRELYVKQNPTDIIEVDYSLADDLEYSLRFSALERSMENDFKKYIALENDGLGLCEYVQSYLDQKINENKFNR